MLSVGPFSYNRFEAYEKSLQEAAKPDYLDFDKDGDKKEPMKKALKEKGKKPMDEETLEEGMPPWLKDKMDKKSGKKESCEDCKKAGKKDCDCDDKKDKKEMKEGNCMQMGGKVKGYMKGGKVDKKNKEVKEAVIQSLMDDGLANNPVSAEIMAEHMSDEWFEAIVEELG